MNYPNNIKSRKNNINYSNRGMSLESDINITNEYYKFNNIAHIYKKPTPIKVTKVVFDSKKNPIIKEAFYQKPSTTDYNGIYKGKYIDFEAKETNSKTSFSLSNIHKHQILHLFNIVAHGGIGFLIIKFTNKNETYLLKIEDLINLINNNNKSISYNFFIKYGYIIEEKYNPRLDYLKIIDKIMEE